MERLSIQGKATFGLIQVRLYRSRENGFFKPADLKRLTRAGDVLLALAAKHGSLTTLKSPSSQLPDRVEVARHLVSIYTNLSLREAEICGALLCGNTVKEVAAVLGIEASSVVTYRKRAFFKLGVTTRRDLLRLYKETASLR